MKFGDAPITPYVSVPAEASPKFRRTQSVLATASKPPMDEIDRILQKLDSPERLRLEYLATLLHVPYEGGQWINVNDGWKNQQSGNVLTFREMKSRVNARISELNLDETLIQKWMQAGDHTLDERQDFYSLPFDERIARFRKVGQENFRG